MSLNKQIGYILYIDTQDRKKISVALKKTGVIVDTLTGINEFGSQILLPLINNILEKNSIHYHNLTAVEVATGPGSFTGLRVGVATANALAYALNIMINGKKLETELTYN